MKKTVSYLGILLFVLVAFESTASAQNRVLCRAEIPFGFKVHGQQFDRGVYQLRQISPQAVRLEEVATQRGVTLISAQPVTTSPTTTLVFRGSTERRFLTEVNSEGYEILIHSTEVDTRLRASVKTTIEMKSGS